MEIEILTVFRGNIQMLKTYNKKNQKLKNMGVATALTITLVSSNIDTLAYANELEVEVNTIANSDEKEDKKEESFTEEQEIVIEEEIVVEEELVEEDKIVIEEQTSEEQDVVIEEETSKEDVVIEEIVNEEKSVPTTLDELKNQWEYRVFSSTNTIVLDKYKEDNQNRDIVIPGEVEGKRIKLSLNSFNDIKSTVTSIKFQEVNGKKVQAPNDSLSNYFKDFTALTSVDLSGLDTSNVTNMVALFRGCISLKSINFNGVDTSSVTNMAFMFKDCSSLTTLNLNSFNTKEVTDIRYIFDGCSSLETLEYTSDFDISNVTSTRFMFNNCRSLKSINLRHFITSKVTDMDNMFRNCSALKSIDLSNFDTSNVTTMTNLFIGCSSLRKIEFSDKFNTSKVTKMNNLFKDCTSLTTIDLRKFDTSNVTDMSYMFSDTGIDKLDLSNFNTSNVTNMVGMFRNTTKLKEIILGDNFNTSQATNMAYMFYNSGVESLDLSKFDTSEVLKMDLMFARLNNIKVLDLSNFNLSKVTEDNMQYMFGKNIMDLDGTIIKDNAAVPKELLVITKDEKLKNYDYEADYCLPIGITLDANGGEFADGQKVKSVHKIHVIESVGHIDKIINNTLTLEYPRREGYTFTSWEIKPTAGDEDDIFSKLNAVYYAKWEIEDTDNTNEGVKLPEVEINEEASNEVNSSIRPNRYNENPQTGDTGVFGHVLLGLTSVLGIHINNRKKRK